MNVHKLRMDTSGNVEDISFVLARKNGDKLGNIANVDNIVTKHSMKEASEFTFTAHKKMGDNIIKFWNDIKDFKLVWIPEWDMWYEIHVEVNEEDENIKNVSGTSLGEAELSQIMLYGIEINTETDIAREDYKIPTTFYNPDHPEASLMDRLLTDKAPHYKVKHIDKSLMNLQRTFTFDDTSIYDALQEVSEELDCLFIFGCGSDENGKPERTISVYDLESNCVDCGHRDTFVNKCPKCGSTNIILGYGEYTNVFISRDNLADEITYSVDTDSVKNCMKLEAGDDLMTAAIRSCNPNGTDYIYYFPDETREEMSPELQEKLKSYDALYEKYQSNYNFMINDSFVTNYNALVNKYKTYEESLKDTEIKNPIVGYPKLMRIYFDTIDMVQLLRNKLMPPVDKPDNNAKSQGEYLMANLPSSASTTSLKNLSVSTADNIMVMLAQSIVKGVFKVTVTNTTLSNNVWKGKFNLENYSDKDDTFTSQFVSISINENYESYVKQRIDSILARADENYYDIVGLFKQDMTVFKSQLKKYCLNTLQIFQKCCQSCIDMMVQQGVSSNSTSSIYGINTKVLYENVYVPYYNKMNAIQDEIKVRVDELYTVEGKYNNQNQLVQDGIQIEIERIITEVQDALNFKNYIGIDLYKEFSSFIRMDKYSNDNYISDGLNNTDLMKNAIEFITVATKELFKSATLQHSITGTIKNFLRMKEFEPVTNNFKNGNWICVGIDDKVYQLRIIDYEIDFSDTQNISVTFSDIIKLPDGMSYYERLEEAAEKMATSYNGVVRQSTINTNFKNKMNEMIAKGLSMTNTKIVSNADNQDITWDEHGLLCRKYDDILSDYTDSQLKIINHGIYITDDNWKTARAGIGNFIYYDPKDKTYKESYGVIADTLVSNLILTSEVGIYNEEKSIEMAKDGIIVTTNTMNKNVFTIRKEITDDEGNITYERQLYIDDNGNIRLAGNASIAWDNVTGTENVVVKDTLDTLMGTLQKEFSDKIVDLEKQNDKKAETWYQGTDPSVDWKTTDDKKGHQGDLWYDTQNQKTYIYGVNGWEETKTNPPDDVFDKIDGKAQIFITQPIPPYNVGDLWFNNETSDIMTCVKARVTGNFDSTEWEKRNKYTDDSSLSTFLNNTYKSDIGNIQNQIDGKIETYRQSEDPSLSWTDADKPKHIGDLWYNTSTNETSMYTGSKWDAVSGNIPDEVWNTIDKKAQIFTDTPTVPYNKGDLWFVGENGIYIDEEHPNEYKNEILTCITAKADGTSFSIDDWQKKNSYTDNSALNEFKNNVGYTQINSEWVISPNIKGGHLMITQNGSQYSAEITPDGKLKATGAEITGAITATSGSFTGTVNADSGTFTNVDIQSGKIGGLTLASNSIKSSNGNFSVTSGGKLTATNASITGNIIATSGSFTGAIIATSLTLSGCKIDYNTDIENKPDIPNAIYYIKKDGTVGSEPSEGATGFKVSSNGLLQASNAIIYGEIVASSGKIGGFNIATTADVSHYYTNTLYRITTDGTYYYQAGISSDGTSPTNATFYVRKSNYSNNWENSLVPFFVRNNGSLYAQDATIGTTLNICTDSSKYSSRIPILAYDRKGDTSNYQLTLGLLNSSSRISFDTQSVNFESFYGYEMMSVVSYDGTSAWLWKGDRCKTLDIGTSGRSFDNGYFKKLYLNGTDIETLIKTGSTPTGLKKNKIRIGSSDSGQGMGGGNEYVVYSDSTWSDTLPITCYTIGAAASSHNHDSIYAKISHSHSSSDINWRTTLGYKGFGHCHTVLINSDKNMCVAISNDSVPAFTPYNVTSYTNIDNYMVSAGGTCNLGSTSAPWNKIYASELWLNGKQFTTSGSSGRGIASITSGGTSANGLKITFNSNCQTESTTYDWVQIFYESNGRKIALSKLGGSFGGTTVSIPSTTFWLYWRTDSSSDSFYGFSIDSITPANVSSPSLSTTSDSFPSYSVTELSGSNYPESSHGSYGNNINQLWRYTYSGGKTGSYKITLEDGTVYTLNTSPTVNQATSSTAGIMKLYSSTGSNTDGTMTQAAIKAAIDTSGGGYTAGVGIKIVNNQISLTGTSKDNYRYVRNPIDGTLHMSNGCGWDLVNTDNKEVTGIYCNGSNEVIISEKDYDTILRGSSIQLGNSNTIVKIPYLPNYTSASKYLVDDGNGNIGWKTISSSGGGSSITGGLTIKLDGTPQISSWKGASDASVNITASSIGAATTSWVKREFGSKIDVSNGYLCLYNNNGSQLSSVQLPTSSGGGGTTYSAGSGISISEATISVDYNDLYVKKIYHSSDTSLYVEVTTNAARYFGCNYDQGLNLGDANCKWKNIWGKNGNITGSDEELKTQMSKINDIPNIESIYMKLNPIKYKYKNFDSEEDHDRFHFGFGARETEKIFNDNNLDTSDYGLICKDILLKPNKAGNIVEYALRYGEFIALNTYMTQKAHHRIDSLEEENQKLKNTILSLQGEIAIIKQKLEELI